jgi:hypothetical protein
MLVIEWLHKQINEEAIHKPFTVGGTITAQSAVEYNKV